MSCVVSVKVGQCLTPATTDTPAHTETDLSRVLALPCCHGIEGCNHVHAKAAWK